MKRILLALATILLATAPTKAGEEVTIDDGRFHCFYIASGSELYILTEGGTETILGTTNANDFDFDNDGETDWGGITNVTYKTTSGALFDSLGVHQRRGGWHTTHIPDISSDDWGIDIKPFGLIGSASAKPDTVLWVKAVNGAVHLCVTGG